jgi:hypothetical protein
MSGVGSGGWRNATDGDRSACGAARKARLEDEDNGAVVAAVVRSSDVSSSSFASSCDFLEAGVRLSERLRTVVDGWHSLPSR